MRGKTLFILLVLVALVAGAILLIDAPSGGGDAAVLSRLGQPLFPELPAQINDVTGITVTSASGQLALKRDGELWRVEARDGYPADFELVRRTLIAVSDLQVLEARTAKPEQFAKLGVEDPAGAGATSALLTLLGSGGTPVAALVIGKDGPDRDTLYARRASENASWLVRGALDVPREAVQWIDTALPPLASSRVQAATVTHADGAVVTVARGKAEDAVWAVQDIADGIEPSSPTVGRVLAAALESMDFEDVRSASAAPLAGEQRAVTEFTTFDGLRLTATSAVEDERTWFTFVASQVAPPAPAADATTPEPGADAADGTGPGEAADAASETPATPAAPDAAANEAVAREVAELNARLAPWVFALPDYSAGNLRKRLEDLVQPAAPPVDDIGLIEGLHAPPADDHADHDHGPLDGADEPHDPDHDDAGDLPDDADIPSDESLPDDGG